MTPRAVCLLGMHHSGASFLGRILQKAGVFLGEVVSQGGYTQDAQCENPRIAALHNDLLASCGGSWDRPPESVRWRPRHRHEQQQIMVEHRDKFLWGFNDPCSLLTLEGWVDMMNDLALIGCFRHPLSVHQSLAHCNGFSLEQSLRLWTAYNSRLLCFHRQYRFPLINCDANEIEFRQQLERGLRWLEIHFDTATRPVALADSHLRCQAAGADLAMPVEANDLLEQLRSTIGSCSGQSGSISTGVSPRIQPASEVEVVETTAPVASAKSPRRRGWLTRVLPRFVTRRQFTLHLHAPRCGTLTRGPTVRLHGQVLCQARPRLLEVRFEGTVLQRIALHGLSFDRSTGMDRFGFDGIVCVLGLPSKAELGLFVLQGNGPAHAVGMISVCRTPCRPARPCSYRPLLIHTLGRSGSTWTMRLLGEHPDIVVAGGHPFEVRAAQYWALLARQLGQPFAVDWRLYPNPEQAEDLASWSELDPRCQRATNIGNGVDWLLDGYIDDLASALVPQIDSFYRKAAGKTSTAASYFAEKILCPLSANILQELIPQSRHVFLVRDFRDQYCSILSFNKRRGTLGFGARAGENEAAFVRRLAGTAARFHRQWRNQLHESILIRYEDLVLQSRATLERLFGFLEIDNSAARVTQVLSAAAIETNENRFHRTTASAEDSIGRWQRELSPAQIAILEEHMAEALQAFGYAPVSSAKCARVA